MHLYSHMGSSVEDLALPGLMSGNNRLVKRKSKVLVVFIHSFIHSYILQANEQDIKISITQTQPQYSMPHGRRRVVTPLTRDQK